MDPQTSLDPLIRAVYIMYKSDKRFLPRSISECVGPTPQLLVRTNSNDSSMSAISSGSRSTRLSFHRSSTSSIKRETIYTELATFLTTLESGQTVEFTEIGLEPEDEDRFKSMLLEFATQWNMNIDKDLSKLITTFQMASARILARVDPANASLIFLYLAHFIDLLLSKRATNEQRNWLLNHRADVVSKKITPPMNINELPKFKHIAKVYNTTLEYISNRVLAMKAGCRDIDILNELERKLTYRKYKRNDFDEDKHSDYIEWGKGRDLFFQKALDRFQQERSNTNLLKTKPRQISPDDPYNCFDSILDMFLNFNTSIDYISMDILTDCLFVWQLDGYEIFISVIKAYLRASNNDETIALEARNTAKKLLDFCCLPYKPNIWPQCIKEKCSVFNQISRPILENVIQELPQMFNKESMFEIITGLIQIIYNSPFGISKDLRDSFLTKLNEVKKDRYRMRLRTVPRDLSVSFKDIHELLKGALEDIQYLNTEQSLVNFENQHSDEWNISWPLKHYFARNVLTDTKRIIQFMSKSNPVFNEQTLRYEREFKVDSIGMNNEYKDIMNKILEIKRESNFPKAEFGEIMEDAMYPDFYTWCVDWKSELSRKSIVVINSDEDYLHLKGVGYSYGVDGLFQLFEEYLTNVENLGWYDVYQNACIFTLIYDVISKILNLYAEKLALEINNDLIEFSGDPHNPQDLLKLGNGTKRSKLNKDHVSSVYVKINNLYTVTERLDGIFRDDVVDTFSHVMQKKSIVSMQKYGTGEYTLHRGKLVCIKISKAESLHDTATFKKLSCYVKINGALQNRTRTIYDESYPEWNEEFDAIVDDTRAERVTLSIYSEVNPNECKLVEAFNYELIFDPSKDGVLQTAKLSNNNGVKLHINYSFETILNDPIFFIGRSRTSLVRSTKRVIKMLVSRSTRLIRSIFTREAVEQAFKDSTEFYRIGDFLEGADNPSDINDSLITTVCNNFTDTIVTLATVLEKDAIEEFIICTWEMIITEATNLILPSIDSINSTKTRSKLVNNQSSVSPLDKLSTAMKGMTLKSSFDKDDRPLTIDELERVFSWAYKLFATICINLDTNLHSKLVTPELTQLLRGRKYYPLTFAQLQQKYQVVLGDCQRILDLKISEGDEGMMSSTTITPNGFSRRNSSVMMHGTITRRSRSEEEESEEQVDNICFATRELVLRVLLAKEGLSSIGYIVAKIHEFERIAREAENKSVANRIMRQKSVVDGIGSFGSYRGGGPAGVGGGSTAGFGNRRVSVLNLR